MTETRKPTLETLRAHREEILRLAAAYGASDVRIFGSVARGESHAGSDVDLLVTFPDDRSIFDMVELWLDLKALLGCEVSLVSDSASDREFVASVEQEAVRL